MYGEIYYPSENDRTWLRAVSLYSFDGRAYCRINASASLISAGSQVSRAVGKTKTNMTTLKMLADT